MVTLIVDVFDANSAFLSSGDCSNMSNDVNEDYALKDDTNDSFPDHYRQIVIFLEQRIKIV